MAYIDLKYVPENDVVCDFYLEPARGVDIRKVAEQVAAESSTGTWTNITTMTNTAQEISARVFSIKGRVVRIAYPTGLFEPGNIPQLLSSVAGNVFGMKAVNNLRLLDIEFPSGFARKFPGPEIGLEEIRKITGIRERPIMGAIFKPKLGLSPRDMADLAFRIYSNGIDYTKDDENLANMNFNRFRERVFRMLSVVDRINREQEREVIYAPNITAPAGEMLKRAEYVKENGGKCIMVDVFTAGFAGLQFIRNQKLGLIIHAHRAMHGAFTRNPKHGVSLLALSKLCRLAGVSALHSGTVVGKMEGEREDVTGIYNSLRSPWHGLKPVMPIASGGLHPGILPRLVEFLGRDMIVTMGGGLWGHPAGPESGARAIRQALDAVMMHKDIRKHAKTNKELKEALDRWKVKGW